MEEAIKHKWSYFYAFDPRSLQTRKWKLGQAQENFLAQKRLKIYNKINNKRGHTHQM